MKLKRHEKEILRSEFLKENFLEKKIDTFSQMKENREKKILEKIRTTPIHDYHDFLII